MWPETPCHGPREAGINADARVSEKRVRAVKAATKMMAHQPYSRGLTFFYSMAAISTLVVMAA